MVSNPLEEIYKKRLQKEKENKSPILFEISSDLLKNTSFAVMGFAILIVLYLALFNDPFREEKIQTGVREEISVNGLPLISGAVGFFIKEDGSANFFRIFLIFFGGYGLVKIAKYIKRKKQQTG